MVDDENNPRPEQSPRLDDEPDLQRTVGPDSSLADLLGYVRRAQITIERAGIAEYHGALALFRSLWWLKQATDPATGELIDYYAAAERCGVGRSSAAEIIRLKMHEEVETIISKVSALEHEHRQRGEKQSFEYPSMSKMLSWYKPKNEKNEKQQNRPIEVVRSENFKLTDEIAQIKATNAADIARAERAEQEAAAERRKWNSAQAENEALRVRIAVLEAELARLLADRANPESDTAAEPAREPDPEPVTDPDPEPAPAKQTLAAIAATLTTENMHDITRSWELHGFRGKKGEHDATILRLRCAFFSNDEELDSAGPSGTLMSDLRKQAKSFWWHRSDRTVHEIIAEFIDPDPSP